LAHFVQHDVTSEAKLARIFHESLAATTKPGSQFRGLATAIHEISGLLVSIRKPPFRWCHSEEESDEESHTAQFPWRFFAEFIPSTGGGQALSETKVSGKKCGYCKWTLIGIPKERSRSLLNFLHWREVLWLISGSHGERENG
jgi:hypothetical protein